MTTNKATQTSVKGIKLPNITRGLYEIDSAMKYYFDNSMKIQLDYDDFSIMMPFLYGTPERWSTIKKYQYVRDKDNFVECPLTVFKRTSVASDDSMAVGELRNPENPVISREIRRQSSDKNRYSLYSVITGEAKRQEILNVIIPDYVILTYEIIVWTEYLSHMNKVIETLNFHSGNYWGDKDRKFRVSITDFSDISEIALDDDRLIKWSCTLDVHTFLLPDIYTKHPKIWSGLTNRKIILTEKT